MSKIKFGALLVDMRGKTGGTVYSRNKAGAYSKNKVTPLNPKTQAQQAQRNTLAVYSQAWRNLSPDERRSWSDGSANYPQTDVFGDQYFLAGNMLYNKLNLNLEKVGIAPKTVCPTPEGAPQMALSNAVFTATSLEIDISSVPTGYSAYVMATQCSSVGKTNLNSKLRAIAVLPAGTGGGAYDFISEYTAKFGTPISGQKILFSVEQINETTGESGVPAHITGVVA